VLGGPRNFLRYLISPKTVEQIKGRNFEIPLAGGFQLTNYVIGLEQYLKIGEEVAVFTTPEDCVTQIAAYLADEPGRARLISAGRERVIKEHTYLHRVEKILEKIWG
jgi:spore maturation protein CgeB